METKEIMTKEEFLKEAQFEYYLNHNTREIFELLDIDVKKLVIEDNLINLTQHYDYELEFFANNCTEEELRKYYTILIDDGEAIATELFVYLSDEQIYIWYEMVYKALKDDDDLDSWKEYHEKDYNFFKSKVRDRKIDEILC